MMYFMFVKNCRLLSLDWNPVTGIAINSGMLGKPMREQVLEEILSAHLRISL